jgi:hypothetical protein
MGLHGLILIAAVALVLAWPARAGSGSPDAVPEAVWWRARAERALSGDPLDAMRGPAIRELSAEWAPLYRSPDGGRFERRRRALSVLSAPGRVRVAAEVVSLETVARGGGGPWWIGTHGSRAVDGAVGVAAFFDRYEAAGAVGALDGNIGLAASGRAMLAPGVSAALRWSRRSRDQQASVSWGETHVLAAERWTDERVGWSVGFAARGVEGSLGQESLVRRSGGQGSGDRLSPSLAWSASTFDIALHVPGARLAGSLAAGEGQEALRIWRDGTLYGRMGGPVHDILGEFCVEPHRAPLRVRMWAGRWSGDARGDLALWPFDELAALFGSRRAARFDASLAHQGVALERSVGRRRTLEGGVACWRLRPRARYESWQATLLGLGRTDESSGTTTLSEATLLGVRLALAGVGRGLHARLEVVQWLPLRVVGPPPSPSTGNEGPGSPAAVGGPTRGGTVLRVTLADPP